ncbi:MAG: hypothetical protein HQM10_22215 [Candidatus Riflebacteria bacterium]|nr:hypothetical protein [Candidatus Riflebacteria bacterium]
MNLVDSCGWMEYFCDTKRADFYALAIEELDTLVVPSVCIYEVFKKILRDVGEQLRMLLTYRQVASNHVY